MIWYNATFSPSEHIDLVAETHEDIHKILWRAGNAVKDTEQAIMRYQAAVVYHLASQFDGEQETIIDLGTRDGYSACVLALAAPNARIFTVESNPERLRAAQNSLEDFENILFVHDLSWRFAEKANDGKAAMVFVDADHKQVARDLIWWDKLRPGGLMLFHDYTIDKFPAVAKAVQSLGVEPSVLCFDQDGNGMAGVYKPV